MWPVNWSRGSCFHRKVLAVAGKEEVKQFSSSQSANVQGGAGAPFLGPQRANISFCSVQQSAVLLLHNA